MGKPNTAIRLLKPRLCPCCKRVLPQSLVMNGARRRRLLDYVGQHPEGVTVWQVMAAIYADDPKGGPERHNVVSVMVKQMNHFLAPQGYRIVGSGGSGSRYYLEMLA